MNTNMRIIKIHPDIGDAYYIVLPEDVQTENQVNDWLDDHTHNVNSWEFWFDIQELMNLMWDEPPMDD